MSETILQKKLNKLISLELGEILNKEAILPGVMVSLSVVRITADLSLVKAYVTAFPDKQLPAVVEYLNENMWLYRKSLASRIKNKMRKMPEIRFYLDDSFQEAQRIDALLDKVSNEQDTMGDSEE